MLEEFSDKVDHSSLKISNHRFQIAFFVRIFDEIFGNDKRCIKSTVCAESSEKDNENDCQINR